MIFHCPKVSFCKIHLYGMNETFGFVALFPLKLPINSFIYLQIHNYV